MLTTLFVLSTAVCGIGGVYWMKQKLDTTELTCELCGHPADLDIKAFGVFATIAVGSLISLVT